MPEARRVDAAVQAGARLPDVRHGGVAGLGAGATRPAPTAWLTFLPRWSCSHWPPGSGTRAAAPARAAAASARSRRCLPSWLRSRRWRCCCMPRPRPRWRVRRTNGIPHEPYSAARLAALRAENRPVFVNATAAWCITCLVNERVAFSSGAVRDAFAQAPRRLPDRRLDAPRSPRSPGSSKPMAAPACRSISTTRPAPPTPQVLPQILTEDEVLKAVSAGG